MPPACSGTTLPWSSWEWPPSGSSCRVDGLVPTTGYKTQVLALFLMQGFVLLRIALRLGLLAGQTALYRKSA